MAEVKEQVVSPEEETKEEVNATEATLENETASENSGENPEEILKEKMEKNATLKENVITVTETENRKHSR